MAGKISAAGQAAKEEFEAAKVKPSARELAAKHGLHISVIHRAPWYTPRPYKKKAKK